MADYKAARTAGQSVQAESKPAENPLETATSEPETKPEPVATEAASKTETQETPAPKRDRSATGRAKELMSEGRVDEAFKILEAAAKKGSVAAARQLEALPEDRTRKPEQATEQPTTTAEKKALKSFLADYFKSNPEASYEDGIDAWNEGPGAERLMEKLEKRLAERDEKERAKTQERQRQEAFKQRMDEARGKYEDFDEVYQNGIAQAEGIPVNPGFQQAIQESDISGELLYHYSKNIAELRTLCNLPPSQAYRAVLSQELKLAMPVETPAATPGKPKLPPSSAPAPVATISGGAANSTPKAPQEARSFSEYKKLRS
jgi:hypothetical protein